MAFTKKQKELLKEKFGGKCAYCGCVLGKLWHADHFIPVYRNGGQFENKKADNLDNLMPSCPPCNISKSVLSIEQWRQKLEQGPHVLERNNSTYRNSIRYGLIVPGSREIKFYFEKS